jgi:hypothetical protein
MEGREGRKKMFAEKSTVKKRVFFFLYICEELFSLLSRLGGNHNLIKKCRTHL